MFVTLVDVWVKPESIEAFKTACEHNHHASIQEAGNRRFDILQQQDDSCHFVLYEAYQQEADAVAHKSTAHYLHWRETVADMMDKPRKGVVYQGCFPA
jgi:autoinducer 2-degrading protein